MVEMPLAPRGGAAKDTPCAAPGAVEAYLASIQSGQPLGASSPVQALGPWAGGCRDAAAQPPVAQGQPWAAPWAPRGHADAHQALALEAEATRRAQEEADRQTREAYEMWCTWLDMDEENLPLARVVHMLSQGGEIFRSFVQFLARVSEPHRSGEGLGTAWCDDEAMRRSCVAMQVACHALAGVNVCMGAEGTSILRLVCYELLGGLQPRNRGCSMHICTVLQHLLSAHDREVCPILLQYHAPFVLLRALDQPCCAELLQALIVGCDAQLPGLVPGRALRPISPQLLRQVPQYLQATSWPGLVGALLEQGARLGTGGVADDAGKMPAGVGLPPDLEQEPPRFASPPKSPARPRPSQGSPRPCGRWSSPGWAAPSPSAIGTPRSSPTAATSPAKWAQASPLSTLALPPSSPSPSQAPMLGLGDIPLEEMPLSPGTSAAMAGRQQREGALLSPAERRGRSLTPGLPSALSPLPGSAVAGAHLPTVQWRSGSPSPEPFDSLGGCSGLLGTRGAAERARAAVAAVQEKGGAAGRRGVGVLVEFLGCILETLRRPRQQPPGPGDPDEGVELRAEVRWQLFHLVFVETAVVSHLFKLLRPGAAQFDSATVLHSLLQYALSTRGRGCQPEAVAGLCVADPVNEQLLGQYFSHMDVLGDLIVGGTPGTGGGSPRGERPPRRQPSRRSRSAERGPSREPWPKSYNVQQPLGALRVVAVQILVALCDLAPERTLPVVKPTVWALLAEWFLVHRCNHIFQAACGRLWIAVVQHGGAQLQHLVLMKHRLLAGLCDAVLSEGACGERWHELRTVRHVPTPVAPGDAKCAADASSRALGRDGQRAEKAQVATCRNRHPGGLGGIVPVLMALEARAAEAPAQQLQPQNTDATAWVPWVEECGAGAPPVAMATPPTRTPLAERAVPQPCATPAAVLMGEKLRAPWGLAKVKAATAPPVPLAWPSNENALPGQTQQEESAQGLIKPEDWGGKAAATNCPPQCYVAKLVAATPAWPQVLRAVGRGKPKED